MPDDLFAAAVVPVEQSFVGVLGLEVLAFSAEEVTARLPVRDALLQPFGVVHGGVHAAVAETVASVGTQAGIGPDAAALGLSNATSFLRPVAEGTLHAVGRRRHRGRTTWVWDVDLSDDRDRLCATARVTVAVRPRAGSGS